MGRIRTIKPEFPQSESMGRVSRDARLAFILLWTLCDDHGRTRGDSQMLASLLFPYDKDSVGKIDNWIQELEREKCILRYIVGGQKYIQIINWRKHQKIDHPGLPKFPDPPETIDNKLEKILEPSRDSRENSRWTKEQGPGTKERGARKRTKEQGALPPATLEESVPQKAQTTLLSKVMRTFEEGHGANFANYAKETVAAKWIIKICNDDEIQVAAMMKKFWELIHSSDKFWSGKPFSPSMMRSMWDFVVAQCKKEAEIGVMAEDIEI